MTGVTQEVDLTHLPAVDCDPWCTDRTGHIHEWHARDQTCSGEPSRVPLRREPTFETEDHDRRMSFLDVVLNREWDGQPYVSIDRDENAGFTMTVDEAEALANSLLERVAQARQ